MALSPVAWRQERVDAVLDGFEAGGKLQEADNFKHFLDEYLGLPEREIYPGVRKLGSEIYDGFINNRYEAAFILAGLGGGKSTLASLLSCAIAHWLLCLEDPHKHFGLLPDKPIVLVNMGPTATQVLNVVFAGIRSFVNGGPFFQKLTPAPKVVTIKGQTGSRALAKSITFSRHFGDEVREIVTILAGHSVETFPVGMNVFFAVVDELSKFRDSEGKSQAKLIFETLDQRRISRFGDRGMIVCVGTAGAEGDYVDRKLKEAEADPRAFVHRATAWEMRGRDRYKGGSFHFAKLDLGHRGVKYQCYDDWPPASEEGKVALHLADIPITFKRAFERDPILALRDFASISSLALHPFDMNGEVVSRLVNPEREHPLHPGSLEAKDWFRGEKGVSYYIHVDLGLGREGGDVAGLAMGHLIGEKRVEVGRGVKSYEEETRFEFRPVIEMDLMLRWTRGERGEILFSEVREFIYRLQDWGFNCAGQALKWDRWAKPTEFLGGVTYDGFQSADSIQILWEHGICSGLFSVDRTMGPYEDLRECLHDNRLDYYAYEVQMDGLPVRIFEHEYKRLELVKGKRVDHPEGGSKDVSDAVAAVVSRITADHKRPTGGWV
jgi:hypothetical protein